MSVSRQWTDSVRKWRRGRRLEARDTGDTDEAEVCSERLGRRSRNVVKRAGVVQNR